MLPAIIIIDLHKRVIMTSNMCVTLSMFSDYDFQAVTYRLDP